MFKQTVAPNTSRSRWEVSALWLRDLVGRNEEYRVGFAQSEFFDLGNFRRQTAPLRSDGSTCGTTMAPRALAVAGQPGMGSSPLYSATAGT